MRRVIDYELNDQVESDLPLRVWRIAAQTAKQVVVQRIREAERSIVYDEFASRGRHCQRWCNVANNAMSLWNLAG